MIPLAQRAFGAGFIAAFLILFVSVAAAHESRPLYIEAAQQNERTWRVAWKIPRSIPLINLPSLEFPQSCKVLGDGAAKISPDSYQGVRLVECDEDIAGSVVGFSYPVFNPSVSTMIKYNTLDAVEHVDLLGPQETEWRVPVEPAAFGVARQYTIIGVEHIWMGWDHLLFLVCLLLIAGGFRRILVTVTGFTIAHSITLALSTLKLIRIPTPPVEAAIALSIVFLAREIAVNRRDSLTWKHPILVSSSFGLLHGFGFAAVLEEVGLPRTQLATGLLFFNIGVEIGQLIFIAALSAVFLLFCFVARRFSPGATMSVGGGAPDSPERRWTQIFSAAVGSTAEPGRLFGAPVLDNVRIRTSAAYGAGLISSYWFIERVMGFA